MAATCSNPRTSPVASRSRTPQAFAHGRVILPGEARRTKLLTSTLLDVDYVVSHAGSATFGPGGWSTVGHRAAADDYARAVAAFRRAQGQRHGTAYLAPLRVAGRVVEVGGHGASA